MRSYLFPRSLRRRSNLRYPGIVDAIAAAIAAGELRPGDRLPTQRDVARHLRAGIATVTKAYAEAQRCGLVSATVGRGTFVNAATSADVATARFGSCIDLTSSRPPTRAATRHLAHALRTLSKRRDLGDMLGSEPSNGWFRHRHAASKWLTRGELEVSAEQVIPCNGVQHALSVIFAGLASPGDTLATEVLNYPGLRPLAEIYGLRIIGVPLDDHGINPDGLDELCRRERVRFLLCSPNLHNPTTLTMPDDRRQLVAHTANRHDLLVVENDILGPMTATPRITLSSMLPMRSFYVTGLTKVAAAGLRLGFIVAPLNWVHTLTDAAHGTTWMPAPLMAELFTLWLEDGSLLDIIQWHKRAADERARLAARVLGPSLRSAKDGSCYHVWYQLSSDIPVRQFVSDALSKGVHVLPAAAFLVERCVEPPNAIRISLGGFNELDRLEAGLRTLASLARP